METELLNQILEKLNQLNEKVDQLDQKIDHGLNSLGNEVSSLRTEMNQRFEKVDATLINLQETVNRIEISQQDDVISLLRLIDHKVEDTAKKSDVDNLRQDIKFNIKENSLFKLELDRLKRTAYE